MSLTRYMEAQQTPSPPVPRPAKCKLPGKLQDTSPWSLGGIGQPPTVAGADLSGARR
jgi:hypothetical protein